jgi:hypothetical protein
MKIGDLVRMAGHVVEAPGVRTDIGIIVGGPHAVTLSNPDGTASYAVVWSDAKTTIWHNDVNLEILSENR